MNGDLAHEVTRFGLIFTGCVLFLSIAINHAADKIVRAIQQQRKEQSQ